MTPVETSPLTRKLSAFVALSAAELDVLERLHQRRRSFVAGQSLVHQGQVGQAAYILSAGWVCSYKIQPDGTRQIVDFQVPGDFLGLRSVLLRTSDHSFEPVVDIQAAEVLTSDLLKALSQTPRLVSTAVQNPATRRRKTRPGGGDWHHGARAYHRAGACHGALAPWGQIEAI
jgi:CRP-like cAMP-binding protein